MSKNASCYGWAFAPSSTVERKTNLKMLRSSKQSQKKHIFISCFFLSYNDISVNFTYAYVYAESAYVKCHSRIPMTQSFTPLFKSKITRVASLHRAQFCQLIHPSLASIQYNLKIKIKIFFAFL